MADIGVLNLTIKDNSEQAARGLDNLTGALDRVKKAVSGVNLTPVANGLKKLADIVNESVSGSTIVKLGQLADELAKLKGLGNLNIKINGGSSIKNVVDSIREAGASMGGINTGFENIGKRAYESRGGLDGFNASMRETEELMKNTNWNGGLNQFREMFEQMSRIRMMFSLPAGEETGLSTDVEKGWTSWKEGAIEVEGTVSDAMDSISGHITGAVMDSADASGTVQGYLTGIVEEMKKVEQEAEKVQEAAKPEGFGKIGSLREIYASTTGLGPALRAELGESEKYKAVNAIAEGTGMSRAEIIHQLTELGTEARKARAQVDELMNSLNKPLDFGNFSQGVDQMLGIGAETKSAEESMRAFMEGMGGNNNAAQQLRELNPELNAFKQEMDEAGITAKDFTSKLVDVDGELKSKKKDVNDATSAFSRFKEGINKLFPGLKGLVKQFISIARRMAIRAIIKQVTKAFQEGVSNVREYSRAIGSGFATDLDRASASLETMRNSLGAAVAPAIQAVLPALNAIVNAAINAFNWINQLLSLLTGKSTWTRATEGASSFEEAAKGAGGAAQEWLAAFDELNVMNNSGGGGGGGGSSIDYENMFEEVGIFDEKIRELAEFLKDNFESIKDMAIVIGASILAWKISEAFAETIPMLSKIAGLIGIGGTIAITLQADWMLTNQYLDTGKDGWLFASILTTAVGTTVAWALAKKLMGGTAAKYTAGITLVLTAATDIIANIQHTDISALDEKSIKTNFKAALEGAAGIGFIAKAAGATTLGTLTAAAGGGLIIFGVATGLKAITSAANTEWEATSAIKNSLLAAAPVGIGLLFLGSTIGVAAGATFATFAVVLGLQASISKSNIKWGTINLTDEEVQQFVNEKMFNVDVKTVCSVIAEQVEFTSEQQNKLKAELVKMMGIWDLIQLGVAKDADLANLNQVINGEDGVIAQTKKLIDEAKKTGQLTLQFTPTLGGDGVDEQGTWFKNYNAGWDKVDEFIKEKGARIGELLTTEEGKKIIEAEPEILAALMQQLSDVENAIAAGSVKYGALANFRIGLGDLDKASFQDVEKYFKEYQDELNKEYTKLVNQQIENQGKLVSALFVIDPDSEEYKNAKAELDRMIQDADKAIRESVDAATADGKGLIWEWITGHHGEGTVDTEIVGSMARDIARSLDPENLKKQIKAVLSSGGVSKEEIQALDLIGITGWDLFAETTKEQFLNNIKLNQKNFKIAIKNMKAIDIPAEDVVRYTKWEKIKEIGQENFIAAVVDTYGPTGIAAIKSRFPEVKATDIIKIVDWSTFTLKQKLEFILAIGKAFGSTEAINAAKNAGINIGDLVQQGMKSKDESVRKAAEEWNKLIDDELKEKHQIQVEAQQASLTGACAAITAAVTSLHPDVAPKLKSGADTTIRDTVKKTVEGGTYTVSVGGQLKDSVKKSIQDGLNAQNYTITVNANISEVGKKIRNAVDSIVATLNVSKNGDTVIVNPKTKAVGGFVNSGDLFIANENGVPEMIGSFGNQTAVANTDQIVEGISRGVANANSAQNTLLAEQNTLLRAILQKDASVRLNASSALGRVAKQSIEMYNGVIGG